jgi:hypothetical protein
MAVTREWLKTALSITGDFETSGDPFGKVTGDFDRMGLSCGVLQWNIGQGSLQRLVQPVGEATVRQFMPGFGRDFWRACNSPIAEGLTIVRGWQRNNKLDPPVAAELRMLFSSPPLVDAQLAAAERLGNRALENATLWSAESAGRLPNLREFCWFFDLLTQNGDLKGLTAADCKQFLAQALPQQGLDLICDWLGAQKTPALGWQDSLENGLLWRNAVPSDRLLLLVLSYLRALKATHKAITLNRKGAIAVGSGWVNRELFRFNQRLG